MKIYALLALLAIEISYSQTRNYSIDYSYTMVDVKNNYEGYPTTKLIGNINQCNFIVDHTNPEITPKEDPEVVNIVVTNVNNTFSDYTTNKIYFRENIYPTYFDIQDDIYDFTWNFIDEHKNILGYTCYKSTTSFRGRIFEVFYTPEIPISHGPLKLNGLPGMILEAYSKDEVAMLHLEAKGINTNLAFENLENPYKDKKNISYEKFLEIYKKKYIESLNIIDDYGNTHPLLKGFEEYYITD